MKITRLNERDSRFRPFDANGGEYLDLWNDGLGVTAQIYRFPKGTSYPEHTHDTWEQLMVLSGRLRISGVILEAGDFAFTVPGETHAVENLEDTVVLISYGKSASQKPEDHSD